MRRTFNAFMIVSVCFALLVSFSGMVYAQVSGRIIVVGVPDKFKSSNGNESTYGLKTVGVGARVVLKPYVLSGTGTRYSDSLVTATGATWTVTGPKGAVTVSDTAAGLSGKVVYFKPDTSGEYSVTMSATTAKGTATASIKVVSSTFVGAGISYGANTTPSTCQPCHTGWSYISSWQKTNHATVLPRRLDQVGGHFGTSCLSCHTAGYNTSTTAVNEGFDDMAKVTGFTVPPNKPGVYDSLMAKTVTDLNWRKMMGLGGIQCENCHGPLGEHVKTADKLKTDKSISSDVCAPCHFSSDRHPKGYSWTGSRHAVSMANGIQVEYTNRPGCTRCHVGQGFIDYKAGNPEPVAPSGSKIYANAEGITCTACHDPHSNANPYQLRTKSVADACMDCHTTRLSSYSGLHHAHQGPMLVGAGGTPFGPTLLKGEVGNWSGWEYPGYRYENSTHSDIQNRCAECHMAQTPTYDPTYAKPDTLLNKVGGHTFAVVYENGTSELLNDVGCRECHGVTSLEYVRLSQDKIKDLLDELKALMPKRTDGSPKYPQDATLTSMTHKAASYNYYFVLNDGSYGVHNHLYAKGLLETSIEQMKLGAGAASIVSVRDVPKDQGKKIQVVWNKFPAEDFSYERLNTYGIWRMDPMLGSASMKASNYTTLLQNAEVGSKVEVNGYVWTFVASVPATNLSQYGYIAETIFDSSIVGGQFFTKFFVAGYNNDNKNVVYQSAVDSGYSVDNLPPATPSGIQVVYGLTSIDLQWKAVEDNDLKEYAVYRSTTPGFNPAGQQPIAKVTTNAYVDASITFGQKYYYKISSFDHAGNESPYSGDAIAVSVEDVGGVPTEFALHQNYPNPFNPSTVISFAVVRESKVRLTIYGVSGQVVATIVNGSYPAGNYRVTWNGRHEDGNLVPSGVYFYHIQTDGFSATKKMMLLK